MSDSYNSLIEMYYFVQAEEPCELQHMRSCTLDLKPQLACGALPVGFQQQREPGAVDRGDRAQVQRAVRADPFTNTGQQARYAQEIERAG
jgi:hypothetical protein